MSAGNFYPAGIGKHIVCIYAGHRPPQYKQLLGASPEPQYNSRKASGKCGECKDRYEDQDGCHALSGKRLCSHQEESKKANMNFTEFVTASAMGKPVTVIDGLPEVLREQKAIGRNLNQLTTLCNMGKIDCPDLSELKEQYAEVLTALNEITRRCS